MTETNESQIEAQGAGPIVDVRAYWFVLVKWRWLVVLFTAVSLATVAAITLRQPKIYQAQVSLVIDLRTPQILGDKVQDVVDTGATYWASKEFYETQYKVMTSRAVAQRVVDKLDLARDAKFLELDKIADARMREKAFAASDPVAVLLGKVRVEPVKDSRIALILAEDGDPKRATELANSMAEAYIDENLEQRVDVTRDATKWLRDQLDDLKTKLGTAEVALYNFKKDNDILTASLEDRQSMVSQRLAAVNDALTRVRTRRAELDARMHQIELIREEVAQGGGSEAWLKLPQVEGSSVVQGLRLRELAANEEIAEMKDRYGENHPKDVAAVDKLEQVRRNLDSEIQKIISGLEIEHREALDTERNLNALLEATKREAFEVNRREIDYGRLKREEVNYGSLYDLVLKRQKESDLSGMLRVNNVRLLDAAQEPAVPARPKVKLILGVGALFSLLGGIALAFFFEYLDNTVKTQEDVERVVGTSFLGIIPSLRDQAKLDAATSERDTRARDLYIHSRPKSNVAESCRAIRTNLLFMATEKPLKKLLVTSSGPKEGKTTTVVNLGITFAQSGQKVLLVDSDMRRPRLHRAFGTANDVGMSSVIVGQARLEQVLKTTDVPGLSLLTCGPVPPNPAELLHTERFRDLVEELGKHYDRVIFDSPPVQAVTDPLILAGLTDGAVLVAKAARTTRDACARTLRALTDVNARVLGVILNDVDLDSKSYGYYYYQYYQRYGYYYGERDKTDVAA